MALSLAARDASSNTTQVGFLDFLGQYADADKAVEEAVAERKNLRKIIKGAGYHLAAFDRARKDADISGEKREAEDAEYRRYMRWMAKPVGFQPAMDMGDPILQKMSVEELKRIDGLGFTAGKDGQRRDRNSYSPGTEAYQRWDLAWVRGQAEIASTLGDDAAATPKRGRRAAAEAQANGHDDGPDVIKVEDLQKQQANGHDAAATPPRRRGRPPGSRNRPKAESETAPPPATEAAAPGDDDEGAGAEVA